MKAKREKFLERKKRVRARVVGTKERPRLSVFRSNKYIYAQLIDDESQKTLVSASSSEVKEKKLKMEVAELVGEALAKKALKKKIKKAVFDRSGYRYHGRVAKLAEGARKGGLEF